MSHNLPLTYKDIIPCSCRNAHHNCSKGKKARKQWKDKGIIHFGIYREIELFLLEAALSSNRNSSAFWQDNAEWFILFTMQCFSYLIIHRSTWKWNISFMYNIPNRMLYRLKLHGSLCPACYSVAYTLIGSLCTLYLTLTITMSHQ